VEKRSFFDRFFVESGIFRAFYWAFRGMVFSEVLWGRGGGDRAVFCFCVDWMIWGFLREWGGIYAFL